MTGRAVEMSCRVRTPASALLLGFWGALGALGLTVLASASACGGSPGTGSATAAEADLASWRTADDPVSHQMHDIALRLESVGLVAGGPTGRGFLTSRGQETQPIEIPRGRCATIVALTSRGIRDLDATLFAPSGDVLAEDVEPDAHPTIQVCAPAAEDRRLYYSLTAYEGIGTYLYVTFLGPRASFGAAAAALGGQPGVVSAGTDEAGRDVRMHEWTEGVARRGFTPVGSPIPVMLTPDQRVRLPLEIELGRCYTVVALGAPGLDNVDLRILDDAGEAVVFDDSPSQDASVQLCATRTADFAAEVHAAAGRGEARVAIFSATEARVGGASGLWLGERREGERASREVDATRDADGAGVAEAGWEKLAEVGGTLRSGGASLHHFTLPPGRCSLIVASGGRGLGRLVLRIEGRGGRTLVERGGGRSSARARICLDASAEVTATVVSRRGEGRFALSHFAKEMPAEVAALPELARGALLDALEEAAADGYRLLDRTTVTEGPLASLGTGTACARWSAVGHAAGAPIALTLFRGEAIVEQSAGSLASVGSCAARGELRVVVGGPGAVELVRFER